MKRMAKIMATLFVLAAVPMQVFAQTDAYTVEKGDSLFIISNKYKVNLLDTIDANKQLADPNLIYPGDQINVPVDQTDIGASRCQNYNPQAKPVTPTLTGTQSKAPASGFEAQVLSLVNAERAKQGLGKLTNNASLANVARIKSEDMRDKNYFDHQSPTYGSPFDMMAKFGIKYKTAGENIAKGQRTPESVMQAWMNSEGHRKNIMNPAYTQLGVGYVTSSGGTTYWTQQFIG